MLQAPDQLTSDLQAQLGKEERTVSAKQDLINPIRKFILKQFPLARQRAIHDDDALFDSGIVDSMGVLDIVAFIESEFDITITDDDMVFENFQSITTLAAFVQSKIRVSIPMTAENAIWTS